MIAIPNMERPESCWQCYNEGCDHWAEYGYDNSAVCPLIDIVRCGECKHWYNDADCGMACEFTNMKQPSDGFCNWGERREE